MDDNMTTYIDREESTVNDGITLQTFFIVEDYKKRLNDEVIKITRDAYHMQTYKEFKKNDKKFKAYQQLLLMLNSIIDNDYDTRNVPDHIFDSEYKINDPINAESQVVKEKVMDFLKYAKDNADEEYLKKEYGRMLEIFTDVVNKYSKNN